ncbi:MAG: hypothetical protein ABI035_10670 [Gemmatimonadaceae bacterium]
MRPTQPIRFHPAAEIVAHLRRLRYATRVFALFALCGCVSMGAVGASPPRSPAADGPFDVVIANGRIVDGTGNPWYYADVAVKATE